MAEDTPQEESIEETEKTALLSLKGLMIVSALLALEGILFAGGYFVLQALKGGDEDSAVPKAVYIDLKLIRSTLKVGVTGKKAFVEFNISLEIDYKKRQMIRDNYNQFEPVIRDRILEKVVAPLRYEELGSEVFLQQLKANIKRVVNEVLMNRGGPNLPKEPVKTVLIQDWRF